MPSALNLVPSAVNQQRPQIVYATVSTTQPVPTGFNDPLYVVEPHRPDYYFEVAAFPAIHGTALPQAGADVVLLFDNTRTWRCVWWSGTYAS